MPSYPFKHRRSIFRAIAAGTIGAISLTVAGFYNSNPKVPAMGSILLFLFAGLSIACATWQGLVNYNYTDRVAYFLSFLVLLAFVSVILIYSKYEYQNGPTPDDLITIDSGFSLNPKLPYETRFTLNNGSDRAIYDIWYTVFWYDGITQTDKIPRLSIYCVAAPENKVSPFSKFSMRVGDADFWNASKLFGNRFFLQFKVNYHFDSRAATNRFATFFCKPDDTGHIQWFPSGTTEAWNLTNPPVWSY